jgi:hypothetical protein
MTCEDAWVGYSTVSSPGFWRGGWTTDKCSWPIPFQDARAPVCKKDAVCFVDDRDYCEDHGARALSIQLAKAIEFTVEQEMMRRGA